MKNASLVICALLLAASAAPVTAAVTVYRDKSAYFAATGAPLETITFDGGSAQEQSVPGDSFSANAIFDLCGKPGPNCFFANSGAGSVLQQGDALKYKPVATQGTSIAAYITRLPPPSGEILFDTAVGFDITGNTSGASFFLENGLTGFSTSFNLSGQTGFFGVVSSTDGFGSFGWAKSANNPDYDAPFFVDTVYLQSPAVPEPASALLLAGGLAWLRSRCRITSSATSRCRQPSCRFPIARAT